MRILNFFPILISTLLLSHLLIYDYPATYYRTDHGYRLLLEGGKAASGQAVAVRNTDP